MPTGGNQKPIEAGMLSYVANGWRGLWAGITGQEWFGPLRPLPPVAPEGTPIRSFDYQTGINLQVQNKSRAGEGVDFRHLRALADNYDLLRLVIETRKDQVSRIPWVIRPKSDAKGEHKNTVARLTKLFSRPDGQHSWQSWIRAALEDVLVVDALSIAPRRNNGREIIALDLIDGATIQRSITVEGRTPDPPEIAYMQVIKGLPAVPLTTDELIYAPRNYRTHKIYGYSPVEQVIMTVNVALRRQIQQLAYYTDGNIPEGLAQVPETWSGEQIKQFQEMFDAMAGDPYVKQHLRFIPALHQLTFTKEKLLTDEMDEWLARVVCYCFSVPATPFVRQVSRGTAQQNQNTATSEGLFPILEWFKELMNLIILNYFNLDAVEFCFKVDRETDSLKQAQIHKIYRSLGTISDNEIRADIGKDPKPGKDGDDYTPPDKGIASHLDVEGSAQTDNKQIKASEEPTETEVKSGIPKQSGPGGDD